MNKEQINELFNYALNKNLKEMFILAGMEDEYTDEPNDKLIKEMLNAKRDGGFWHKLKIFIREYKVRQIN